VVAALQTFVSTSRVAAARIDTAVGALT
jgi:hypothetical protein